MPLQSPLIKTAYDDMHAILTHYEAKEAGLGHRIAHRLRDKLQRGTLRGDSYRPYYYEPGSEGCMWCTVTQEVERIKPDERPTMSPSDMASDWNRMMHNGGNGAEAFVINHIKQGMTPANSPAADALDASIEDWLMAQQPPTPFDDEALQGKNSAGIGLAPETIALIKEAQTA